jgi:hypothetical protein
VDAWWRAAKGVATVVVTAREDLEIARAVVAVRGDAAAGRSGY